MTEKVKYIRLAQNELNDIIKQAVNRALYIDWENKGRPSPKFDLSKSNEELICEAEREGRWRALLDIKSKEEKDEEHWRNIDLTYHHRGKQRYFDYLRRHMTASEMQDLKDLDMSGYYDRL